MPSDHQPRRLERAVERVTARARRVGDGAARLVRNPLRLVIGAISIVLVVLAVPLVVTGARLLDRAWSDWRHETSVREDWITTEATVVAARSDDGLGLRLAYTDADYAWQRTQVHLDSTRWVPRRVEIRYDPERPSRVEVVGLDEFQPLGSALVAVAALGAGGAALVLGIAVWRRRKLLAVSAKPMQALVVPLAIAGTLLAGGLAAWVVGTVTRQSWFGVVNSVGDLLATIFADMLGIVIPLLAFVAGCLVTAWLARHRHHEQHEGLLSDAYRMIDRAAGYAPSPDELKAGARAPDTEEVAGAER
ncbi:MAG: hypothetical protein FJW88_07900 [Actinobacteria bacterium]|nr:hypothetical protein [Actinomycetota bacterium]